MSQNVRQDENNFHNFVFCVQNYMGGAHLICALMRNLINLKKNLDYAPE